MIFHTTCATWMIAQDDHLGIDFPSTHYTIPRSPVFPYHESLLSWWIHQYQIPHANLSTRYTLITISTTYATVSSATRNSNAYARASTLLAPIPPQSTPPSLRLAAPYRPSNINPEYGQSHQHSLQLRLPTECFPLLLLDSVPVSEAASLSISDAFPPLLMSCI